MGPPPARYTIGVHEKICEHIRAGNRPIIAAQMAGIPSATFYQWMKLGKTGNPHLYQFVEDVEKATADAEGAMLQVIIDAAKKPDSANSAEHAKWYLERTRSAGYSKEVNLKVDALLNDFMDKLQEGLPPDIYDKVLAVASGVGLPEAGPSRFTLPAAKTEDAEIVNE